MEQHGFGDNLFSKMNKECFSPCHWLQVFFQLLVVATVQVSVVGSQAHRSTVEADVLYVPALLSTHPRLSEINAQNFNGDEGSFVKGFQLQKAFIAVTPGILLPPCFIPGLSSRLSENNSGFCDFRKYAEHHKSSRVQSYSEILDVKEKVRNRKTKSGLKIFQPFPERKSCKCESLSAVGVSQLILLGEYLLKSYFGKLSSLDKVSQHSKFAETVGDETLYQSLNALLHGLLTEKQFVATDVAKLAADFSRPSSAKGELHQDLEHFIKQSYEKETHLFKETKVSAFQSSGFLENYFGPDLSSKDIISLLSNKFILESQPLKRSEPENKLFKTLNLSLNEIDQLFNASDLYHSYLSSSPIFKTYARSLTVSLRQLLKIWLLLLPQVDMDDTDDLKFISVDNLFMLSFLSSLNIPVNHHIPPSSRLVIEIHELPTHRKELHASLSVPNILKMGVKTNSRTSRKSAMKLLRPPHYVRIGMEKLISNIGSDFQVRNMKKKMRLKTANENEDMKFSQEFQESQTDLLGEKGEVKSQNNYQNVLMASSKENKPLRFVRVLYNGQVVTAFIPGCENDHMVSLGLCSAGKLDSILDISGFSNSELHHKREEL